MEYLNSGLVPQGFSMDQAMVKVKPLLDQCRPVTRNKNEADPAKWPKSTLPCPSNIKMNGICDCRRPPTFMPLTTASSPGYTVDCAEYSNVSGGPPQSEASSSPVSARYVMI